MHRDIGLGLMQFQLLVVTTPADEIVEGWSYVRIINPVIVVVGATNQLGSRHEHTRPGMWTAEVPTPKLKQSCN